MKVSIRHAERRTRQLVQLAIRRTPLEGSPVDSTIELRPTQCFEFNLAPTEFAEIAIAGANSKYGPVPVHVTLEATEPGELVTRNCLAYGFAKSGEVPGKAAHSSNAQRAPVAACGRATVEVQLPAREACGLLINNYEEQPHAAA